MSKTIFISAGELSGDAHGARLARALLSKDPSLKLCGIGSSKMREAGVDVLMDMSDLSTVGIAEVFGKLLGIASSIKKAKKLLKDYNPDVFVPIDNQGFHMILLKAFESHPMKKIYYIAPQEWQWGTEKGGLSVLKVVDEVLAIFPEEKTFYERLGGNVSFVGHPIVDLVDEKAVNTLRESLCIPQSTNIISIFPGSRSQEIKRVSPVLMQAAALLENEFPESFFVVSVSDNRYAETLKEHIKQAGLTNVTFYHGHSQHLIREASCSLSTSGTITLEHAMLKTPCVVAYKFHPITYFIAKTIMAKQISRIAYMSLPNLILNREIFPEFLQFKATPEHLANAAKSIMINSAVRSSIEEECQVLITQLGKTGVVDRAAERILSYL